MSNYTVIGSLFDDANAYQLPITALSFDPVSDTLWTGRSSGQVLARHSIQGIRGVQYTVDTHGPVIKIIAGETHVRALGGSGDGVGQWSKGGMNKWFSKPDSPVRAFSNSMSSSQNLSAATSTELLLLNGVSGAVIRRTSCPTLIGHLHYSHNILLSGGDDGYLRTHDPRTGLRREGSGTESAVQAHSAGILGLQTNGNYVYSIGWGNRRGHLFPDPMVKIYDMRQLKPLSNIPFPTGPSFLNTIPRRSASTVMVTSREGLVNIVDAFEPDATEVYQLNVSFLNCAAVSTTGTYLAFGDQDGTTHLMSISPPAEGEEPLPLNGFEGQAIEWANELLPLPEMDWDEKTPLNTIGLPYYNTPLLSSWTSAFIPSGQSFCPPPPKIPAQVLASMKFVNGIGYGTLPKEYKGKRNVTATPKKVQARFRSGKIQRLESEDMLNTESSIPKAYRKVEIEYSKFGVEDFDFAFYNRTGYSGLETHILNCYVNPVLQALHYMHPIRQLVKSHVATDCASEHCLMCEMGFVSRNLEDAKGSNCHAGNFCKTLGLLAQANNAPDLIDYGRDELDKDYAALIQAFSRFLLDRLLSEGTVHSHHPRLLKSPHSNMSPPPPITQLTGINMRAINACSICSSARERSTLVNIIELMYPRQSGPESDFTAVLKDSLVREIGHKANCATCKRLVPHTSRRVFKAQDLPPVLVVHACVSTADQLAIWKDQRKSTFLRSTVTIKGNGEEENGDEVTYAVRGFVTQIVTEKQSHLVSIIQVPSAEQLKGTSPWFVFNDFAVRNVSEQEALSFPDTWKVPAIVYLEKLDVQNELDFSTLPTRIDEGILYRDTNVAVHRDPSGIKHQLLTPAELPTPGTVVAIDAEFVLMQQEETEFRSDGSKKMLRPARLSLARVSVLRGGEYKHGIPFIDDHIHTSEMIVDNLTEYSGIKYGDLDPHLSRHTLTPLKTVYKKLRLLVDRGCIFIGHGLSKDFRMINIYVPPDQVLDTVDIYFLQARQRRLSLKFLTWYVLKEQIQLETHDSIEDARSALRLYLAFLRFEGEGVWEQKLDELYRDGKAVNFKPPAPPNAPTNQSQPTTPSISGGLFGAGSGPRTISAPMPGHHASSFVSPFLGMHLNAAMGLAPELNFMSGANPSTMVHPELLRQALASSRVHSPSPAPIGMAANIGTNMGMNTNMGMGPQGISLFRPGHSDVYESNNWRSPR